MTDVYEITYDYCSEEGYEEHNCREEFEGDWTELQDYIKKMKKTGCYNIDAVCISDYGDDDEYVPSSTAGDYSPSNPWDAPGMCIEDFI